MKQTIEIEQITYKNLFAKSWNYINKYLQTDKKYIYNAKLAKKMPYHRADTSAQADKLSGIVEESDLYEGFAPHVETSEIKTLDFYNLPKQTGELNS